MKNSGLFLNMAKCFFWGFVFCKVLMLKGLFLVCLALFQKCQKCLFFPSFGVFFLGWLIVVHLGLEGLGVLVFLVFVFLFCVAFVSVLFALFLVLWLDVVFFFWFVYLVYFVFFGGFKGQVRWPEGPPHLALNPNFFLCFFLFFLFFCCFFSCFCLFVFLEGLRVRWGGPKGHLTWP